MRIIVLLEEDRLDDAGIVLESIGFAPDDRQPVEPAVNGIVKVIGELPEKDLHELGAVIGLRDWQIAPPAHDDGIDGQKPETD